MELGSLQHQLETVGTRNVSFSVEFVLWELNNREAIILLHHRLLGRFSLLHRLSSLSLVKSSATMGVILIWYCEWYKAYVLALSTFRLASCGSSVSAARLLWYLGGSLLACPLDTTLFLALVLLIADARRALSFSSLWSRLSLSSSGDSEKETLDRQHHIAWPLLPAACYTYRQKPSCLEHPYKWLTEFSFMRPLGLVLEFIAHWVQLYIRSGARFARPHSFYLERVINLLVLLYLSFHWACAFMTFCRAHC